MIRRPPRSTRTDTLFPYTTLFRTLWKIGWLPLGGYVQFAGDRDAVSQPDAEWQSLPAAERAHSFPAQPVWKRALIVAAGPVPNLLFAILSLAGFARSAERRVGTGCVSLGRAGWSP